MFRKADVFADFSLQKSLCRHLPDLPAKMLHLPWSDVTPVKFSAAKNDIKTNRPKEAHIM